MKRILVPTDFSPATIRLIEKLKTHHPESFDVLLTHLFYLPDGIHDLLFSTYRVKEYEFVSTEFKDSFLHCMGTETTDTPQQKLPIRFFYGNTLAFFKNFIQANGIDLIAYSGTEPVKKLNSSSMTPVLPILQKCGVQLINVDSSSFSNPVQ